MGLTHIADKNYVRYRVRIEDVTKRKEAEGHGKYLNKYDVIFIDMNSIRYDYICYTKDEELQVAGVVTLVDYLKYAIIDELREQKNFAACFEKNGIENSGLLGALSALRNDLGAKFIFIMDEWDLIIRDYRNDAVLQEDFMDLLRGLFKSDGGRACFLLVYLTGILPIKKINSESALNDFA